MFNIYVCTTVISGAAPIPRAPVYSALSCQLRNQPLSTPSSCLPLLPSCPHNRASFVSVQARLDLTGCGHWCWQNRSAVATNACYGPKRAITRGQLTNSGSDCRPLRPVHADYDGLQRRITQQRLLRLKGMCASERLNLPLKRNSSYNRRSQRISNLKILRLLVL